MKRIEERSKLVRLWLDDERAMPLDFDIHVKDPECAIFLLSQGRITHISLDHDLGLLPESRTGYTVATWIEEQAYLGILPRLTWAVHSANPVGRARMVAALEGADRYWLEKSVMSHSDSHQSDK